MRNIHSLSVAVHFSSTVSAFPTTWKSPSLCIILYLFQISFHSDLLLAQCDHSNAAPTQPALRAPNCPHLSAAVPMLLSAAVPPALLDPPLLSWSCMLELLIYCWLQASRLQQQPVMGSPGISQPYPTVGLMCVLLLGRCSKKRELGKPLKALQC